MPGIPTVTIKGRELFRAAIESGPKVSFAFIAIGDGRVQLTESAIRLTSERERSPITGKIGSDNKIFTSSLFSSALEYDVYEIGLFDDRNRLIAFLSSDSERLTRKIGGVGVNSFKFDWALENLPPDKVEIKNEPADAALITYIVDEAFKKKIPPLEERMQKFVLDRLPPYREEAGTIATFKWGFERDTNVVQGDIVVQLPNGESLSLGPPARYEFSFLGKRIDILIWLRFTAMRGEGGSTIFQRNLKFIRIDVPLNLGTKKLAFKETFIGRDLEAATLVAVQEFTGELEIVTNGALQLLLERRGEDSLSDPEMDDVVVKGTIFTT